MSLPDLTGYKLEDGLELINKYSLETDEIKVTSEPRKASSKYDLSYRILRYDVVDKKVRLLLAKPLV
ncbi:MAG TPA: hypothetical protein PK566_13280 [Pseudobacteroides sp.]|nr:hypothetical protein [Pseudobacteroides sp.]